MSDNQTGTKPDYVIKIGAVRAALWASKFERDGRQMTDWVIEIARTVKVGDTFKSTSRFTVAQLHSVLTVSQLAFEHIVKTDQEARTV
jgi:hypothetical protein